ncbi:MAG: flagellar type III secretion system pore protein FliP [Deltaproteobacteria bacterium]|nr:flagellar type III secretion system pore protein FliP [Deltaproteobacteria bacterium]
MGLPRALIATIAGVAMLALPGVAAALPGVDIKIGPTEGPAEVVSSLKIMGLLTVLAVAPAILMTMTSFTRIIIVFSFLRQAIGTPTIPPNQVMIGLSLFLTMFVMAPVGTRIYDEAVTPYRAGAINEVQAFDKAVVPLRDFMLVHTRDKDLALFYEAAALPPPATPADVSMRALVPAFVLSELKTAFEMGFLLFIPFIVLDIAIASLLMSMGMIMLPPALISLPLKLMLFVIVDGWNLVVGSLLRSFMVPS